MGPKAGPREGSGWQTQGPGDTPALSSPAAREVDMRCHQILRPAPCCSNTRVIFIFTLSKTVSTPGLPGPAPAATPLPTPAAPRLPCSTPHSGHLQFTGGAGLWAFVLVSLSNWHHHNLLFPPLWSPLQTGLCHRPVRPSASTLASCVSPGTFRSLLWFCLPAFLAGEAHPESRPLTGSPLSLVSDAQ